MNLVKKFMAFKTIRRYLVTISYLKWSQIFWRLYFKIIPAPKYKECKILEISLPSDKLTYVVCPKRIFNNKFIFINLEAPFIDWKMSNMSMLWRYNLHYFIFLEEL